MSYKCSVCQSVVHGSRLIVTVPRVITTTKRVSEIGPRGNIVWRDEVVPLRTEIDREVPVCADCQKQAVAGVHAGRDAGDVLDKMQRARQPAHVPTTAASANEPAFDAPTFGTNN